MVGVNDSSVWVWLSQPGIAGEKRLAAFEVLIGGEFRAGAFAFPLVIFAEFFFVLL